MDRGHAQEFTEHLKSIDPEIHFTFESEVDNSLAFLDTKTIRTGDSSLKIKIYRKLTHTDQDLNWQSNHPVQHKRGVVSSLHHRAESVVTEDAEDKKEELAHVDLALQI